MKMCPLKIPFSGLISNRQCLSLKFHKCKEIVLALCNPQLMSKTTVLNCKMSLSMCSISLVMLLTMEPSKTPSTSFTTKDAMKYINELRPKSRSVPIQKTPECKSSTHQAELRKSCLKVSINLNALVENTQPS